MTLELIPNGDLVFKGPFNAVSTTALKLSNSGTERLAYKIKTTAPKRYCVKPNSGFLEPNATASIQVMLQPQTAGQADDRGKHKFMVQWVAVPSNYADDVDNFWKQDMKTLNVQDSKLKCVFNDEQPAAVVPVDTPPVRLTDVINTSDHRNHGHQSQPTVVADSSAPSLRPINVSPPSNPTRPQDTGDDSSKARLKQEIDHLKEENDSLRDRLKQQETTLRQRTTTNDRTGAASGADRSKLNQQSGLLVLGIPFNEQLVLVVFVIALLFGFSLGYFLFSCGN